MRKIKDIIAFLRYLGTPKEWAITFVGMVAWFLIVWFALKHV